MTRTRCIFVNRCVPEPYMKQYVVIKSPCLHYYRGGAGSQKTSRLVLAERRADDWNKRRRCGLSLESNSESSPMNDSTPSPEIAPSDAPPQKPYVVVSPAQPRFPDVLAEITRAQPLTMLSVAFVAGLIVAAGWRR